MKSIPKVLQRHVWQYASDDGPMVCECIRKQCTELHCTVFLVIYFCSSCLLARVDGHSTKLHDKRAKFFNCLFEEAKKKLKMAKKNGIKRVIQVVLQSHLAVDLNEMQIQELH